MHHLHLLTALEGLRARHIGVELQCPGTLEIDGVEQVAHGIHVKLIRRQHLLDHPLRVVARPLVDDVHRLAVSEVARFGRGIVERVGFLLERLLQLVAAVHVDGVANHHLRFLVNLSALSQHLQTEVVNRVCIAESQNLVDLLLCLPIRSVVQHTQRVGDAQGRQYLTAVASGLAEQVKGEIVVSLHQLPFLGCERNLLRSLETRGIKIEISRCDVGKFFVITDAVRLRFKQIVDEPFLLKAHTLYSDIT